MFKKSVFILIFIKSLALSAQEVVVNEDFEGELTTFGKALVDTRNVTYRKDIGTSLSSGIKVSYQGYGHGSERVLLDFPIPPASSYKLVFNVKFCKGFDFVKGGKLHGFGSRVPLVGGDTRQGNRWSARILFSSQGGVGAYIYHKNNESKFGDYVISPGFKFEHDVFYNVELITVLNEPSKKNGSVSISVDGVEHIYVKDLEFVIDDGQDGKISTLMFNTFHGGSDNSFAPLGEDGKFSKVYAVFDDFRVIKN